jgi:hypothetical protein
MRRQVYDLLEKLKYCSPLGSLVRGVRGSLITRRGPTLGVGTIRKLEATSRFSDREPTLGSEVDIEVPEGASHQTKFVALGLCEEQNGAIRI